MQPVARDLITDLGNELRNRESALQVNNAALQVRTAALQIRIAANQNRQLSARGRGKCPPCCILYDYLCSTARPLTPGPLSLVLPTSANCSL